MSLKEINFYLENNILVSDLKLKRLIGKKRKSIFKDCLTRGKRWKRAFQTEQEAVDYVSKDSRVYYYKCDIHGFHVSQKDSMTIKRGYLTNMV